jgi:hypothetical protein
VKTDTIMVWSFRFAGPCVPLGVMHVSIHKKVSASAQEDRPIPHVNPRTEIFEGQIRDKTIADVLCD